jgi:hypothetical protein
MWIDLLPLAYIQYGLYVRKVKILMGYLDRVTDIAITKGKITKGQTTIYKKTTQKKTKDRATRTLLQGWTHVLKKSNMFLLH